MPASDLNLEVQDEAVTTIASALIEQIVADTPDLIFKEIKKRHQLIEKANAVITEAKDHIAKNNAVLQGCNNLLPDKLEEAINEKRVELERFKKLKELKEMTQNPDYESRLTKRVEEIKQKIEELMASKAKAENIPKAQIRQLEEKTRQIELLILADQKRIKFAQEAINTLEQRAKMLEEQRDCMLKIEQPNKQSHNTSDQEQGFNPVACKFM